MSKVSRTSQRINSIKLPPIAFTLLGLMLATPVTKADDGWDNTGPAASQSGNDFDLRSRQDSRRKPRSGPDYSLIYVNGPASEPDQIPEGTPAYTNVIDARTLRPVRRISLQDKPHHFYKVPHQNKAYLSHFGGTNVVSVLDLLTNRLIAEIPAGNGPRHMEFSDDGKRAWTANLDDHSVTMIDTKTDKAIWTTKVTSRPNYVEEAFGYAFVANLGGASLSVLDARTGKYITDVPTGAKPFNMAVSCDEKYVMSANAGDNTVSFVDVANLTELARVSIMGPVASSQHDSTITQRLNPRVSPDCKYLWVGNQASGTFAVLDIAQRKLAGEVRAAGKGGGSDIMFFIRKGPAAGMAIGTNRYSSFTTVINPNPPFNVIKRIPAGKGTHYVWLNHDASEAYVSSRIEGSFSIYDLRQLKEVARKGGFGPIDQAAFVSFEKKTVASSVTESGDPH